MSLISSRSFASSINNFLIQVVVGEGGVSLPTDHIMTEALFLSLLSGRIRTWSFRNRRSDHPHPKDTCGGYWPPLYERKFPFPARCTYRRNDEYSRLKCSGLDDAYRGATGGLCRGISFCTGGYHYLCPILSLL